MGTGRGQRLDHAGANGPCWDRGREGGGAARSSRIRNRNHIITSPFAAPLSRNLPLQPWKLPLSLPQCAKAGFKLLSGFRVTVIRLGLR